jgi:SAM-dependent methyltransferase
MKLNKIQRVKVQYILRKIGLLPFAEQIRFFLIKWSLKNKNKKFLMENPDFIVPPEYLAFDAYSAPDWEFYKSSGEVSAKFIANAANQYFNSTHPLKSIYEWGCGPGRVIRHLSDILGNSVGVFGSDYNLETINWCKKSFPGINFFPNDLNPPLSKPDNTFDLVYSISVFTHLSEESCLKWADELFRVIKPGGILMITTAGDYHDAMLDSEKTQYMEKGIVVRGNYEEGKKMFFTRHSPRYVREKLLNKFDILVHEPAGFPLIAQDCWIAQKPI